MAPPKLIYLVRHGESEANVDWDLLKTTPDWKVGLTERGRQQALTAGAYIKGDLVSMFPKGMNPPQVATYCSPYARTKQTWDLVWESVFDGLHTETGSIKGLLSKPFFVHSADVMYDPRIREQDWGNYKDSEVSNKIEAEREKFGTFFYRIPDGESGADVYDRLSSFMDTLWRDFDKKGYPRVTIIVTHGLTMRLFLMRWFHLDVDLYENIINPRNAEVWRISSVNGNTKSNFKESAIKSLKWHLDTQISFKEFK